MFSPLFCPLRVVSTPLSKGLGVKDKVRIRAPLIPKLENFYELKSRQPSQVSAPAPFYFQNCSFSPAAFNLFVQEAEVT